MKDLDALLNEIKNETITDVNLSCLDQPSYDDLTTLTELSAVLDTLEGNASVISLNLAGLQLNNDAVEKLTFLLSVTQTLKTVNLYCTGLSKEQTTHLLKAASEKPAAIKLILSENTSCGCDSNNPQKNESCEELRRSRDLFKSVADNTCDWEILTFPNGNYKYISPSCERITGYSPKDFYQNPSLLTAITHSDDKEKLLNHLQQSPRNSSIHPIEFRIIKKNGDIAHIELVYKPIYDEDENIVGKRISNRDVTERKAYQEEREKTHKNRAEFLRKLCHEIRNPIAGIDGSLTLALQDFDALKELINKHYENIGSDSIQISSILKNMEEYLSDALTCKVHTNKILDDTLDSEQIDAGRLELKEINFNIKEAISSVISMLRNKAIAKKIEINTIPEKQSLGDITIQGDELRFKQVILNLLGNAIKFTPEDGKITITTEIVTETSSDLVLSVIVQDNGIGLDETQKSKLFQEFSQIGTHPSTEEGSGLGLSISKKIAFLMAGDITCESEIDKGSCFTFTSTHKKAAPAHKTKNTKDRLSPSLSLRHHNLPSQTAKFSFLLVEDEPINQKIMKKLLERRGHSCVVACNGQEALEKLDLTKKAQKNHFDCILMDIMMPEMNGLEATQEIRKIEHSLNINNNIIIGLSGNSLLEDKKKAFKAGMDAYLIKPVSIEAINTTLFDIIRNPSFKIEKKKPTEIILYS